MHGFFFFVRLWVCLL